MGFFSWRTSCSDRSIANTYSARSTFPVLMVDDKGNTYLEESYEGYGVFGGKDYYQLVAEMNTPEKCSGDVEHDRSLGIDIVFKDNSSGDIDMVDKMRVKVPILVEPSQVAHIEDMAELWRSTPPPPTCEFQGFFYDDEEDEDCYDDEYDYEDEK